MAAAVMMDEVRFLFPTNKARAIKNFIIGLCILGCFFTANARAADEQPPENPYSGGFLTRSTLTGDWWGVRNDLARKGVTLDMNITNVEQGIVSGGKDRTWEFSGRGDITLNVDTQKLGLWPGGFLTVEGEGNYNRDKNTQKLVNGKTGALMSVNTSAMFPLPGGNHFNLPELMFAQFLSPYAGLFFGKLETSSGDPNEFAHGKGDKQFMNLALNFNPLPLVGTPYSGLGAGIIVLPTKDPNQATVTFNVIQTNGKPNVTGFDDLEGDKLTFAGEGRMRTDFFGLTGHQLFGYVYSNAKFTSIDQSFRFIIENQAIEAKKGSWNIHYNFDQYLYEPQKGRGVGIFGRFGASDGNPNPLRFFGSVGVGGKGMFAERPNDRFGLGFYYIDIKQPTFRLLTTTRKFLRDEYGFEAFYNFALTPWLTLSPDIQVIRPAQRQTLKLVSVLPPVVKRNDIDPAVVLGLRMKIDF
jgi:porin